MPRLPENEMKMEQAPFKLFASLFLFVKFLLLFFQFVYSGVIVSGMCALCHSFCECIFSSNLHTIQNQSELMENAINLP